MKKIFEKRKTSNGYRCNLCQEAGKEIFVVGEEFLIQHLRYHWNKKQGDGKNVYTNERGLKENGIKRN